MKCLHTILKGRVQGVGFRFNTCMIARQFPVTGYVRNLEDGSVELEAEGEQQVLENFLNAVRQSSLSRYIETLENDWSEAKGQWKTFDIR